MKPKRPKKKPLKRSSTPAYDPQPPMGICLPAAVIMETGWVRRFRGSRAVAGHNIWLREAVKEHEGFKAISRRCSHASGCD